MTTQKANKQQCKQIEKKHGSVDRKQFTEARQVQMYAKVFNNVHYKTDKTLCDLGTISSSSSWFWESYPM